MTEFSVLPNCELRFVVQTLVASTALEGSRLPTKVNTFVRKVGQITTSCSESDCQLRAMLTDPIDGDTGSSYLKYGPAVMITPNPIPKNDCKFSCLRYDNEIVDALGELRDGGEVVVALKNTVFVPARQGKK